ncbi:MAG: ABC transporter permease [Spirochaetes bacterium]|nr:ABC transporter permease [Spirochaetota bacterium]MBU0954935.1 ABC transporter permease [Spirochaetota bacterium]
MYKWYVLNRLVRGVVIFCLLMVVTTIMFNSINEKLQRSVINEQVKAEAMRLKNVTPEQLNAFRMDREQQLIRQFKLDRPLAERILHQSFRAITFQFGKSTLIKSSTGSDDVRTILFEAIPRTLFLFTTASVFSIVISISLGLKKAQKPGGRLDRSTSFITLIVSGIPGWWLGMMFIMFFAYQLKWFPAGGVLSVPTPTGFKFVLDALWHLMLPLFTLIALGFWGGSFVIRNIVLSILQEDYIMAARARGVPENKVLFGHTMRTAAPPLVTMVLLSILGSISGGLIFEGIFSWPGLGNLYWVAVQTNDIPVLMGNLAITVGLYQAGLVILDLIYGFLDPRIKTGGKA